MTPRLIVANAPLKEHESARHSAGARRVSVITVKIRLFSLPHGLKAATN